MADIDYDDPEEQFDGCECQYCAVGAPGCWRATGVHLKEEIKNKDNEIAELKQKIDDMRRVHFEVCDVSAKISYDAIARKNAVINRLADAIEHNCPDSLYFCNIVKAAREEASK